jgi:hypothetical protein
MQPAVPHCERGAYRLYIGSVSHLVHRKSLPLEGERDYCD